MKNWYEIWKEKKPDNITGDNYSSGEAFLDVLASLQPIENVTELNPEMNRPGEFWDIVTGKAKGYCYPAIGHNNYTQLEGRITQVETGNLSNPKFFGSLVFPRGMAAISAVLEAVSRYDKDGIFIHGKTMYPSTKEILAESGERNGRNMIGTLPGVEVDLGNHEELSKKLVEMPNILGIILEPVGNPSLDYIDIRAVADVAHVHDVPVIVDNTFLTPYLLEPFRMGADIVVHSLTKYFSGQGDMLGGAAIIPMELMDDLSDIRKHKGYTLSPGDAYKLSERVPGILERMEAHCKNAHALAGELKNNDGIRLNYVEQPEHTRNGYIGGVLSFTFSGDNAKALERAIRFTKYLAKNTGVVRQALSLAEEKTLVLPWGGQILDIDYLLKNNVSPGLVRVACGREKDYSAVIDYIRQGIAKSL